MTDGVLKQDPNYTNLLNLLWVLDLTSRLIIIVVTVMVISAAEEAAGVNKRTVNKKLRSKHPRLLCIYCARHCRDATDMTRHIRIHTSEYTP